MTHKHNGIWRPRKLDELGFVGRGKSRHRPRNAPELYDGPYPFVQTADIMASEFYITSYSKTYSEAGLAQSKMWGPNTLCMTIAGENTAETAILSFRACFPDSVVGFVADPEQADVRFVKYYLDHIRRQIRQVTRGATQDNLSLDKLLSFDIIAPPVQLQSKIASIAAAYDELILNNQRRMAVLEKMAQAIYREWFVNFRFPGHEKVKLINSPLGKVPEGWKVVTVEELASHSTEGIAPAQYPEEEFAHFSIPNYDKGQLPELETGATIQSNKFVVLSGCVMLSKLNPRIPRIWLPESYGDYRPVASTEFLIVSPLAPATREFIYYQFQSDDFSGRFRSCSSGTSTSHQRVKPTDFVKLKALLPPSSLIEAFTKHVAPMCRLIHNRRIHNRNLRTTRDLLLPKLISGQLDVVELDIETGEPLVEAEA